MPRIRTVEHDAKGGGWIARNPWTGEEVWPDFLWRTRAAARAVVEETRLLKRPKPKD